MDVASRLMDELASKSQISNALEDGFALLGV